MPSTTGKPDTRSTRGAGAAAAGRPRSGRTAAVAADPRSRHRWWVLAAAVGAAALAAGGVYAATWDDDSASSGAAPYVGGDLHTITAVDDRLYVGGHDGVAVSADGGQAWAPVPSLGGADAMGWAQTTAGLLVGGHPGLYRSTDDGATFTKTTGEAQVGDVHAVGAAGDIAYLASPQAGLLASRDGGATWEPRNTGVGQGFMGTILVDPADPQRIIAPDMANGLVTSSDGGRTWSVLGGPGGAMSAGWDPTDTGRLVAVGMSGAALSSDGGRTWTDLQMPEGTSAATFSTDGTTLYAAALDGDTARLYTSTDDGRTWTTP
ncbi:MAG: hypothetical protein H0W56_05715 [Acidothermales bacterium]|nr:hypothetical protein [Acidothermales bacterium]